MPVFRLSLKIIKKNIPSLMIYMVIFVGITMIFAGQIPKGTESTFVQSKVPVAFFAEEDTPLVEGFKEMLSGYADFIEIEDTKEAMQDALYFRDVTYILRVPKGFTEAFLKGEPLQLEKTIVPGSVESMYLDININEFFSTATLYLKGFPEISQEALVKKVTNNIRYSAPVKFQDQKLANTNRIFAVNYFNYLAYSLFSILILGISAVLIVLNKKDIKQRNTCSPVSVTRMNLEFLLAHFLFTIATWAIFILFYYVFDKENFWTTQTLYFALNGFIFALCASSISFLIGSLVKNQNALSGICNVLTLGFSFISGVFVPQELLSSGILKVSSFTPTYWFVKTNGIISNLTSFDMERLSPALSAMGIEIGYAIAVLCIALVINKRRRMSN